MNEYDRLYRQAQRYREMYPEGTRILLLHMGDDPHPVEDNMSDTVKYVDDMCTLHCKFDNGRQLGIIPGEDSFRKLTISVNQGRAAARLKARAGDPVVVARVVR